MISLLRTDSENPAFAYLTNLLDEVLCDLYNTRKEDYEDYNRITNLQTVLLAYADGIPIGCGCFKLVDDQTVEIKRMFVLPTYRGQGLAKRMLSELESWAISLGYSRSILETGKRQSEAIALYRKMNYEPIERYTAPDSIGISVCFAKTLGKN
ncbi:GNAT family N-acetyltransferase [Dyadobacter tibetensis]|uniref:GNAT family N-acetyltransferase n=1 Tax=Dyadobacter tibetensis TaxID=1211851 RepID=UPI000472F7A5|nr:GNAT family N-acetyltransferase [Dyadobacter tibetensis]